MVMVIVTLALGLLLFGGAVFGVAAGCGGHFVCGDFDSGSLVFWWLWFSSWLLRSGFDLFVFLVVVLLGLWFAVLVPLCRVAGGFAAFGFLVIVGWFGCLLEFWWFAVNFDAMWAGVAQLCSFAGLCCCYLVLG